MAVSQQNPTAIAHVDRPDLAETFADSVGSAVWDGQTARVELCVTRYPDSPIPGGEARRYPACRLVLTPAAVIELSNRLQQVAVILMQSGLASSGPARVPEKG